MQLKLSISLLLVAVGLGAYYHLRMPTSAVGDEFCQLSLDVDNGSGPSHLAAEARRLAICVRESSSQGREDLAAALEKFAKQYEDFNAKFLELNSNIKRVADRFVPILERANAL